MPSMNTYRFDLGSMHIWHRHATDAEAMEAAKQIASSQGRKVAVNRIQSDDQSKGTVGVAEP
jgi:hypothetical protein